jgi:hypothetical protein
VTQLLEPMSPATSYTVTFRPKPGIDAIKSLRALLKFAGRRLGLRAVDVRENLKEEQQ